jgi:hypothetical protein
MQVYLSQNLTRLRPNLSTSLHYLPIPTMIANNNNNNDNLGSSSHHTNCKKEPRRLSSKGQVSLRRKSSGQMSPSRQTSMSRLSSHSKMSTSHASPEAATSGRGRSHRSASRRMTARSLSPRKLTRAVSTKTTGVVPLVRPPTSTEQSLQAQLVAVLGGEGPVRRFGPVRVKTAGSVQVQALRPDHAVAYQTLQAAIHTWQRGGDSVTAPDDNSNSSNNSNNPLDDHALLRVTAFCKFVVSDALQMWHRLEPRYWGRIMDTGTAAAWSASAAVVPMPFFPTKAASESLYLRLPAQPQQPGDALDFLSMVTYALHALYERHRCSRRKVAVILNMQGWNADNSNFGLDGWLELIDILRGHAFPVRVTQLLVVNAPTAAIAQLWRHTRPVLRNSHMRCHVLKVASEWPLHLPTGASVELLPDALGGLVPVATLVQEFVNFRRHLEELVQEQPQQLPVTNEELAEKDGCRSPGKDEPVPGLGSFSSLLPPGDTPHDSPKTGFQRQLSELLPMVPSLIPAMEGGNYSADEEEELILLTLQQETTVSASKATSKSNPKPRKGKRGRVLRRTAAMPNGPGHVTRSSRKYITI